MSASDSEVCHRGINGFVVLGPGVPREKRLPLIEEEAKIDHAVSHIALFALFLAPECTLYATWTWKTPLTS